MYSVVEIKQILKDLLQQQVTAIGEYELIQLLNQKGVYDGYLGDSVSLQLFQKHFLTMHCLYQLQYDIPGAVLQISPLHIALLQVSEADATGADVEYSQRYLRDYYLDLSHLDRASDASVADLLSDFWQKYLYHQAADDALSLLDLSGSATWAEIQTAYRQKAQLLHPDKGGCPQKFAQIREAYEQLKRRQRG